MAFTTRCYNTQTTTSPLNQLFNLIKGHPHIYAKKPGILLKFRSAIWTALLFGLGESCRTISYFMFAVCVTACSVESILSIMGRNVYKTHAYNVQFYNRFSLTFKCIENCLFTMVKHRLSIFFWKYVLVAWTLITFYHQLPLMVYILFVLVMYLRRLVFVICTFVMAQINSLSVNVVKDMCYEMKYHNT